MQPNVESSQTYTQNNYQPNSQVTMQQSISIPQYKQSKKQVKKSNVIHLRCD